MGACTLTWLSEQSAHIKFNRPGKRNAMNADLLAQWSSHLTTLLEYEKDLHCVIISGDREVFSAGADISPASGLFAQGKKVDLGEVLVEKFHPIITKLQQLACPIIMAIDGPCVGIGCAFSLYGDITIATKRSYFWLNFIDIGLVPDGGSTYLLPRRVGMVNAFKMAMLGEKITAKEGKNIGLVSHLTEVEQFNGVINRIRLRLESTPIEQLYAIKHLLNGKNSEHFEKSLTAEADFQSIMGKSECFHKAMMKRFLAKKSPK